MELNVGLLLFPREHHSNIFFSGYLEIWTGSNHGSFKAATPLPMASWAARRKSK
jgi:hypothetical protein